MKTQSACANRLGNRPNNEDRCLIIERPGRVLLAVADGMGGHARGELAAQTAIDSFTWQFEQQRSAINKPAVFLQMMLENAHFEVIQAGRQQRPAVDPRTTCVVCLVQDDHAWWAHLGDSRLYLVRRGRLLTRTCDHTPLEELRQAGAVAETEMHRHPLRNSVSRCLGGAVTPQPPSLAEAALEPGDVLLLCSDGLWSALSEEQLVALGADADLAGAVERLAGQAERASYPRSDNISLVALRWLAPGAGAAESPAAARPRPPATAGKDPVQKAIDAIHRAMLDYAAEMKKNGD